MGVAYNSRIITDGLVLALDASNNKSILSTVEVLVVAGGGGGGMDMGGGGGGGGVLYSSAVSITPGSAITATVGNGGVGAPAGSTNGQPGSHQFTIPATQGGNSVFGALTAIGGGFGGSSYRGYTPGIAGGSGGSGGGASGYNDNAGTFLGGLGTSGQGNRGGNSTAAYYSGGGGGAGAPGADSTNQPNGGVGVENSILGVSYFWGGGGGGASYSLSTGGNGGNGGGGGGALGTTVGGSGLNPGSPGGGGSPNSWANTPGGNAGANTGGGGGGGSHYNANNKGGDGGSGIIIVRYPGSQRATGGTVTSVGGYTIHTFTTSGTFTPTWGDMSTNGNTGTLTNGPTYSSANGGSLVFDGTDDYILGTIPSSIFSGAHSIGCWFYRETVTEWAGLFSNNVNTTSCSIFTFISTSNSLGTNQAGVDGTSISVDLGADHLNKWIYAVITYAGVTSGSAVNVYAYKNGSLLTATGSLYWNLSSSSSYYIGRHWTSASQILDGFIPQVSVYNRALTAAEVSQNFNALRGRFGI